MYTYIFELIIGWSNNNFNPTQLMRMLCLLFQNLALQKTLSDSVVICCSRDFEDFQWLSGD